MGQGTSSSWWPSDVPTGPVPAGSVPAGSVPAGHVPTVNEDDVPYYTSVVMRETRHLTMAGGDILYRDSNHALWRVERRRWPDGGEATIQSFQRVVSLANDEYAAAAASKEDDEPPTAAVMPPPAPRHRRPPAIVVATHKCTSHEQGGRPTQEDTDVVRHIGPYSVYGIFDGHGGGQTSERVASLDHGLARYLVASAQAAEADSVMATRDEWLQAVGRALRDAVVRYDENVLHVGGGDGHPHQLIVGVSGSTATILVVRNRTPDFSDATMPGWIINVGDSRTVVYDAGSRIRFQTRDHKPGDPIEMARIQRAGGRVVSGRVGGILAVARALGDFPLKRRRQNEQFVDAAEGWSARSPVSSEPDVTPIHLKPGDRVVLACDGVWDMMSSEEAAASLAMPDPCRHLVQAALSRWRASGLRADNVSALVVALSASNPRGEAVRYRPY